MSSGLAAASPPSVCSSAVSSSAMKQTGDRYVAFETALVDDRETVNASAADKRERIAKREELRKIILKQT